MVQVVEGLGSHVQAEGAVHYGTHEDRRVDRKAGIQEIPDSAEDRGSHTGQVDLHKDCWNIDLSREEVAESVDAVALAVACSQGFL